MDGEGLYARGAGISWFRRWAVVMRCGSWDSVGIDFVVGSAFSFLVGVQVALESYLGFW